MPAKPEYPKAAFAVRLVAALRVKTFASTDVCRYYLNGVHIEAHPEAGAVCVATDGHRLGVRFDREGLCLEDCTITIPPEIKAPPKLLKSPWLVGILTAPGKGHISVVEAATSKDAEDTPEAAIERVEDCILRVGRAFIDGKYPDWRRVIPAVSDDDAIRGFNADYIKGFGKAFSLRGADASSPHLIKIDGESDFLGVLMPMRVESPVVPAWLAEPKPAERKKAA